MRHIFFILCLCSSISEEMYFFRVPQKLSKIIFIFSMNDFIVYGRMFDILLV